MRLVEVEVGSRRFEASVVLQLLPSPSFVLNLKSPEHSYFVKGFAGSRESVTQMASVEFGQNRLRYGVRLQMSTPKLDDRLVWSPSAFFLMPESGEAEVMRAFLSLKENAYGFASEFSFSTLGAVADYVNLQITGGFSQTTDSHLPLSANSELSARRPIGSCRSVTGQCAFPLQ
ncbi:hypothetical protein C7M84_022634 [Penaeus vannamei]|uniref:Uncharacterized protein n=1 Tax=Penaeus vannamei TaxID=6689 RepID=A0A423U647_PENVA|nr:hypothetical protein C7M84_022634 [Penaeus vannamei]